MQRSCQLCGGEAERRSPAAHQGGQSWRAQAAGEPRPDRHLSSAAQINGHGKMLAAPLHSHDSQQWHQPVDTHVVPEPIKKKTAARFDETRYRPREQSVLLVHKAGIDDRILTRSVARAAFRCRKDG